MDISDERLARFFNPKSIAIIGGADAAIVSDEIKKFGFKGITYGISRSGKYQLGTVQCQSVSDLHAAPDLAFVGVPAQYSNKVVSDLSNIGCGGAICFAAGFSELGEQGIDAEEKLVQAAGEMPLLGPNCYGYINSDAKVAAWPYFHGCTHVERGPVLISQSGMLATSLTMNERSVNFKAVFSLGNQASLGAEDVIHYFINDPSVTCFALYLETIRDLSVFLKIVKLSIRNNIPVVLIAGGVTGRGREVAIRHTGSLLTPILSVKNELISLGVTFVESPEELLETTKLFTLFGNVKGNRCIAFTCSGGDAAILADVATRYDLCFPTLDSSIQSELRNSLPNLVQPANPFDLTTILWGSELIHDVFSKAITESYDIAIFVQDYPRQDIDFDPTTDIEEMISFINAANSHNLPAIIVSSISENLTPNIRSAALKAKGIPMQGFAQTAKALQHGFSFDSFLNEET